MNRTPRMIAHRGASSDAPENTLAAFRLAVESGADGVEFDVRLSKDGVPVVIHDADLIRTAGINKPVAEMTAAELGRVDNGSWFGGEFAGERIPTLAETLDAISDLDGPIYIELKCGRDEVDPLALSVCNIAAASKVFRNVIVKGFNPAVVPVVKTIAPNILAYCLFDIGAADIFRQTTFIPKLAYELGADGISLHSGLADADLIAEARRIGLRTAAWTIDDESGFTAAANAGIEDIITNEPAKLLAFQRLSAAADE